jgi:hypothetical protein
MYLFIYEYITRLVMIDRQAMEENRENEMRRRFGILPFESFVFS